MSSLLVEALHRVLRGQDLTRAEARTLLGAIFAGEGSEAQVAGLLVALAMKGETVDEIVGFAEAMRTAVTGIGLEGAVPACVDTCGTGGNSVSIFNVSTTAAFVVAGAGLAVAKHGNRTSRSVCGSADVLEAMGVNLACPADRLGNCLREIGIAFLFAPLLHGAMRNVMPARKAIQIRTIFNLLGPLTNPAGAPFQVVGVPALELLPKMAGALSQLGTRHSFVVRSQDGLGEYSTTAPSDVTEIRDGQISTFVLDARDLGLPRAAIGDLICNSKEQAAARLRAVLNGESGPHRDIVCLNAAAALVAGARASTMAEGLAIARAAIDSGAARAKLEGLIAFTHGRFDPTVKTISAKAD